MAMIIPLEKPYRRDDLSPLDVMSEMLSDDISSVNQIILQRMDSHVDIIPRLAGHIIASGGKRMRPLLTLACARLCGYEGMRHRKLAACVEFIHTATLLHDDVVDESALRRGLPSANILFGNQASVLVGDFLLSRAFELMVEDGSLDVLKILSRTSSVVAEGEVLQLMTTNDSATSEQAYLEIIRDKTAELFASACRIGAIVAERSASEEEALRTFGLNLGIAFQIVDDVLDYSANEERLGKTVGNDFREGKITLPAILAIHRGNDAEHAFWKRTLDEHSQRDGDFAHAQDLIHLHDALSDSIERARHYADIARDSLGLFSTSPMKRALLDVVDFTIEREF
ncbi:MAG: polyprenyl synthetase family protein [Bdellovibrionales bacterium]